MTEPNGFTTLIAILILVLIVLAIRFILKHGSHQHSVGCTGNCTSCGMGCMSSYSPEKKQFDAVMEAKQELEREKERKREKDLKQGL